MVFCFGQKLLAPPLQSWNVERRTTESAKVLAGTALTISPGLYFLSQIKVAELCCAGKSKKFLPVLFSALL